MLTTPAVIRSIPGSGSLARLPDAFLNLIIPAADQAARNHCKRDLELQAYEDYYGGDGNPGLVLRQRPVWVGLTAVAAGSGGLSLPQATINVTSTRGFNPGTGGDPGATAPALCVQAGPSTWTTVRYTGTTATAFTGCTGGSGTLTTGNAVSSPVVYENAGGYSGFGDGGFTDKNLSVLGRGFIPEMDRPVPGVSPGGLSESGVLTRLGTGPGSPVWWPYYPGGSYLGKLAASRKAGWQLGQGNVKVLYSAGYRPVPPDLSLAVAMLALRMIRGVPMGAPLSSESLGSYGYSLLNQSADWPELGDVLTILNKYRETSW